MTGIDLSRLFDFVVFATLFSLQGPIVRFLLRHARKRSAAWYGAAVAGVCLGALAICAGILLSVSQLVSRFHLPPRLSLVAGGTALLYLFTTSGAVALFGIFRWLSRRIAPAPADTSRRRFLTAAGGALASAPFAIAGYGAFVQRTDFKIREIDVPYEGLPDALNGLRLLHLSDIHLSAFLSEAELARVIDASNGLRPHIAFVTGDLISTRGDPLDACLLQIARLRADAGIFGCLGNHERYAGAEDYTAAEALKLNIRFLRRRAERLRFGNARLGIAGVDYQRAMPKAQQDSYLRGTERLIAPGAFNIMLSHNPDVFPVSVKKGYDLTLSGHTHGGQVSVEILDQQINPARFFTPYVYGLYREGNRAAYVTRGIGTIGIPARIGAAPEISLVRLRKA